ncbi:hypothetical protein F4604DRAFT_1788852 [Suillus subluteus]|nr:hypothetical protein F4604DRAFT_1788852 [Suillus subluteus]
MLPSLHFLLTPLSFTLHSMMCSLYRLFSVQISAFLQCSLSQWTSDVIVEILWSHAGPFVCGIITLLIGLCCRLLLLFM